MTKKNMQNITTFAHCFGYCTDKIERLCAKVKPIYKMSNGRECIFQHYVSIAERVLMAVILVEPLANARAERPVLREA